MRFLILKTSLLVFLVSCAEDSKFNLVYTHYCSYESQEKRAIFTQRCIKDANPMSDEEPEDMIKACVNAAESIYCFWGDQFQAQRHYKRLGETLQEEI